MKRVRFSWDYSKLDNKEFSTLRRDSDDKYFKDNLYDIVTPNVRFIAKCVGVHPIHLKDVCDKFLMEDTDTNSREEALKTLRIHYPDLKDEDVVLGVFFERATLGDLS